MARFNVSGLRRALGTLMRDLGSVDEASTGIFYRPHGNTREVQRATQLYNTTDAGREDIYNETGLIRDYGPKTDWLTEMSDAEATMGPAYADITEDNWLQGPFGKTRDLGLPDILQHDRLYSRFPALRNMPVRLMEAGSRSSGGFQFNTLNERDPSHHAIFLNFRNPLDLTHNTPNYPVSLPMHETQHAIQAVQGHYGMGSNSELSAASPLVARWQQDYMTRLAAAIREADDAYWAASGPERAALKARLEQLQTLERNILAMPPEDRLQEVAHKIYQRAAREDVARRLMRRLRLTQAQIDSRAHPPWRDRDVPEGELDLGGYFLNDILAEAPNNPAIARLLSYLVKGAGAVGALGLSVSAARQALADALAAEDA